MKLTSTIVKYDENWPELFKQEEQNLRPVLGDMCTGFHHIGSTAVVGLAAKPEIDILAIVTDVKEVDKWQRVFASFGYQRGRDLSKDHHFFKRNVGGIRTHKLHICLSGHSQIRRMLKIRDHLRCHDEDRMAYEALKLRLEQENSNGISEYLKGKSPFLDDLYNKIK